MVKRATSCLRGPYPIKLLVFWPTRKVHIVWPCPVKLDSQVVLQLFLSHQQHLSLFVALRWKIFRQIFTYLNSFDGVTKPVLHGHAKFGQVPVSDTGTGKTLPEKYPTRTREKFFFSGYGPDTVRPRWVRPRHGRGERRKKAYSTSLLLLSEFSLSAVDHRRSVNMDERRHRALCLFGKV